MIYRVLSILTWLGTAGFCGRLVAESFRSSSPMTSVPALVVYMIFIAAGAMTMTAHLNSPGGLAEDEKDTWRKRMRTQGPLAVAHYLWIVAGRSSRPDHIPTRSLPAPFTSRQSSHPD